MPAFSEDKIASHEQEKHDGNHSVHSEERGVQLAEVVVVGTNVCS